MPSVQNIQPALSPGDKLGYFEVQQPLAAGGMALVWKGRDPMLNRDVAIKQLAAGGSIDEVVRDQFRKEVEIQKKVSADHPHLVQVIDYIEESRGLFLVMEYVDGSSLDRVLAKQGGPLPPKEALTIMHQVTLGLAAIHEAGVLHRDLKPANILLPRDGGAKICDFGLATLTAEQDALTHGTARYMAPELYSGEQADARCDLYSLGFVTYEMLVGRPAFEEAFKTVMRDQRNQALRWMKWHTNQRLTAPAITKLNPDVPQPLADVVTRLMDKDPMQRPASARQLVDVLKRTFSGQKPAAQQAAPAAAATAPAGAGQFQSTAEKTAPLPQKSKVPMILAIVLGVQILLVGGYFAWDAMRADTAAADARAAAMDKLNRGRELYNSEQYKQAGMVLSELAANWGDDPEIGPIATAGKYMAAAQVTLREGEALTEEGDYAGAERKYDIALAGLDLADETHVMNRDRINALRDEIRLRRSFVNVAAKIVSLTDAGEFSEARHQIRLVREAKPSPMEEEILDKLAGRIEGQSVQAQIEDILARAERLEEQEKFDEARALIEQATKQFESDRMLQERYRELSNKIRYQNALSMARRAESGNNLDEARKYYREANKMNPSPELQDKITELSQKVHYQAGVRAQREGNLGLAKDEFNKALPYGPAKRALEDLGQMVDKSAYVQAGDNAMTTGDYAKAIDLYGKALEISRDGETAAKLTKARLRQTVAEASAAVSRGDLDEAEKLANAAQQMDPSDAELSRLQAQLQLLQRYTRLIEEGDAYRAESLYGDALTSYRKALNLITGTNVDPTEVKQRLSDTEYESWIAKGRAAMEARQWRQARGHLKTAQRERDTQTVRDLLAEVDRNDPDGAN